MNWNQLNKKVPLKLFQRHFFVLKPYRFSEGKLLEKTFQFKNGIVFRQKSPDTCVLILMSEKKLS